MGESGFGLLLPPFCPRRQPSGFPFPSNKRAQKKTKHCRFAYTPENYSNMEPQNHPIEKNFNLNLNQTSMTLGFVCLSFFPGVSFFHVGIIIFVGWEKGVFSKICVYPNYMGTIRIKVPLQLSAFPVPFIEVVFWLEEKKVMFLIGKNAVKILFGKKKDGFGKSWRLQ